MAATGFARAVGVGLPERSEPEGPQGAERGPPVVGYAVLRFVTALIDTERRMCYNALVSNTRKTECNDNYIHNAH